MLNCFARAHGARRLGVAERGTFLASAKYFAPIYRRFRRDCRATRVLAHPTLESESLNTGTRVA